MNTSSLILFLRSVRINGLQTIVNNTYGNKNHYAPLYVYIIPLMFNNSVEMEPINKEGLK